MSASSPRSLSKRVPKELADAQAPVMREAGIYYWYDDADLRIGRAMIIGPPGTPYEACPLVFEFHLPDDYPFRPPKVQFLTSDGITRFHPNLYVGGKVCLSILGTWKGPEWSAVMTVSSVLSSIQSLLEPNPLVNEPGFEQLSLTDPRAAAFAAVVQWRLACLVGGQLAAWKRTGGVPATWTGFEDVLEERGAELLRRLTDLARSAAAAGERVYADVPYGMSCKTSWAALLEKLEA